MKCKKCGASLLDTDKFCSQCGWKVVKERRCPECGAALREGTKFCPKCGVLIGSGKSDEEKVFASDIETSDIPIGDIEQNILFETERELHTAKKKRPASAPKKSVPASAPKKSVPAPEPKKKKKPAPVKKKVYEEWNDEEEDDEDDDDDTGSKFMVIMTAAMAFLIITIAAVLVFYTLSARGLIKYGTIATEEDDNEADDVEADGVEAGNDGETEAEPEDNDTVENEEPNPAQPVGTLSIVGSDKVNVRDNPSTEGTNIIKKAKAGETYEYMGTTEDDEWYMILLEDGSIGYVFGKYVSAD